MQSLINKNNIHSIPFGFLCILFLIYICPNTRYLSVGENSFLPVFIFLLGYSFFNYKEIFIYSLYGISCLIFPIFSSFINYQYSDYSFIGSAMSFYIGTIPIISSITLGRFIGARYFKSSKNKIRKEFYLLLIGLAFLFFISAFLKLYYPSILYFFLHAGRTSHNRVAFFFIEPSQGASIFIFLLLISFYLLTKNKFSNNLGKSSKKGGLIILLLTTFLIYLSQPLTLFAQIFLILFIILLALAAEFIKRMILKNIMDLKLLGLRKSRFLFVKIIPIILSLIFTGYYAFTVLFQRVIGLLSFVQREGLFLGLMISAGNRFYYAFTSIIEGINNPISIPGDWVGKFSDSLVNILEQFSLTPPDSYGLLQLYKTNPLVLKPSGWFYFGIYDLGIIGIIILSILLLNNYIRWIINGIKHYDFNIIVLFSIQISLLVIPLLPSTPSAFFPLLISAAIIKFKEEEVLYSKKNSIN